MSFALPAPRQSGTPQIRRAHTHIPTNRDVPSRIKIPAADILKLWQCSVRAARSRIAEPEAECCANAEDQVAPRALAKSALTTPQNLVTDHALISHSTI